MSSSGSATRRCSRQTCSRDAIMTLTYVYSDSTAVVGPLAGHAEPHAYDLCSVHADRLTVPRGWRVVRLELPETRARREDIGAVAEAVREPEPSAPVRERRRTVLRDVSLPRASAPGRSRPGPARTAAPEVPREPAPGTPRAAGPEISSTVPPASSRPAAPGRSWTAAPEASRATGPAPAGTPAAQTPRTTPRDAPRGLDREPGPEVVWHDLPVPGSLQRPHLRRPTAR
ncbi:DUF3499 family protein [Kocuria kalidii]|uniref:DUF3499 family protein n=1 Tax=Kocuria kalidii TaxID=3376283 RepID=UPI0037A25C10